MQYRLRFTDYLSYGSKIPKSLLRNSRTAPLLNRIIYTNQNESVKFFISRDRSQ